MGEDRSSLDVVRESRTLAFTVGAITLGIGIVLLFWPERTLVFVARLSGVLLLVIGITDLLEVVRHHRGTSYWGLFVVRAAINAGFGLALLFWPGVTINVVVWLIGLDMVLAGLVGLVLRGQLPDELRTGTLGRSLATIAFGVVLMVWPDKTVNLLTWLVGGLLAAFGAILLWTGWRVSKLADREARAN